MVQAAASGEDRRVRLRRQVAAMLDAAWRDPGFCVPNAEVYPHQWLWDSCFHAVIWAYLGSDRGVTELANALAAQADDGFVPHMVYHHHPDLHADLWGRSGASVITQPPMYGHALAEQRRVGCAVPDALVERACRGLLHLADRPRTPAGLIPVFHPWETGCDDSPRWDRWFPDRGAAARRDRKTALVAALHRSGEGHAIGSSAFAVGSIGFNALVAWNARELLGAFDLADARLGALADDLAAAVAARWVDDRWVDEPGPTVPTDRSDRSVPVGVDGSAVRTLDSMLALLVDPRAEAFEQLVDPEGFGAAFGPRGVHRAEVTYQPEVYWRGSAWPQLTYLLLLAAERAGRPGAVRLLAGWLVDGAERSGFAEHWNPETGSGLGARPQSWTGLAVPAARRR